MEACILVIDDKQHGYTRVGDLLNREGYKVIWSSHLFRNLFALEWLQPDLIVVDRPTQDAWHLLRRLTVHLPTLSIPIIICTDANHAATIERERELPEVIGEVQKERFLV